MNPINELAQGDVLQAYVEKLEQTNDRLRKKLAHAAEAAMRSKSGTEERTGEEL